MTPSCNQWVHLGAVGGMVQDKRSRECCRSWTVLHAQCTSVLSARFHLSQGNAEALNRIGDVGRQGIVSFPTFSATLLPKIIVMGDRVCQDYSKSEVGRFYETQCIILCVHMLTISAAGLELKQTYIAGTVHYGVFSLRPLIPRGTKFGPFRGCVVNPCDLKASTDNFMWGVCIDTQA